MILLCGKDPVGTTTQAKTLAAETGNLVCDSGSQDHGPWTLGAAPFSRTAPPQRTRTLSVLRGMKLGSLHTAPFSGLPPSVCKDVNPAWRQTCKGLLQGHSLCTAIPEATCHLCPSVTCTFQHPLPATRREEEMWLEALSEAVCTKWMNCHLFLPRGPPRGWPRHTPVRPAASADRKALQDRRKNRPVSSRGNSCSLVNLVKWQRCVKGNNKCSDMSL